MRRTNTTSFTTFNLPSPEAATFTFPSSPETSPTSPDAIRITTPPSSSWRMRLHWHPSEYHAASTAVCQRVTCISGDLHIYASNGVSSADTFIPRGSSKTFRPRDQVAVSKTRRRDTQPQLTFDLVVGDQGHALWRNICSAALDRDVFPKLDSTPLWLKGLFAVLGVVRPTWKERLLDGMLWVQTQAIFFSHDYHLYHGSGPFLLLWNITHPFDFFESAPRWVMRWQWRSMRAIAWVVMSSAYWVGRLFLGMKGEYGEYTPHRDHRDEKS